MVSGQFHALKISLAIGFIRKTHWLSCNDAVPWLNEAKTQIFQPTANFENQPVFRLPASQPASLP